MTIYLESHIHTCDIISLRIKQQTKKCITLGFVDIDIVMHFTALTKEQCKETSLRSEQNY